MCKEYMNHEPGEKCEACGLVPDRYRNTEDDFRYCSFPDCGCDGARLCMAGEANDNALKCNVEGMYQRTDKKALRARMELIGICLDQDKKEAAK